MKKLICLFLISITFFGCLEKQTSKKETEKLTEKQPKGIWIDLILGGPPLPNEFKAIDLLTKKYKINYKRIEMGCEYSENDILLKEKYKISNATYFRELESVLGKNWKQKFDLEKSKLYQTLI
jgi:hypothetical protein